MIIGDIMSKKILSGALVLLCLIQFVLAYTPNPGHGAGYVGINTIGIPSYLTLSDFIDVTQSAGKITGGIIVANPNGSINISAGSGFIKTTNSPIGSTLLFDWDASNDITVPDNDLSYVGINYNSGSPVVFTETTKTANGRTKFYLGKVYREGANTNVLNAGQNVAETQKSVQSRLNSVFGEVVRASGLLVSEVDTRTISITSGSMFAGLTSFTISAINTNESDTFEYYYYDGASWIKTDETEINNTHYNDISSGLVELTSNRYGVHWVYMDNSGKALVVYGQGDYTLSEAEELQPPSLLPTHITAFSELIAKIIIQEGASSIYRIESAFDIAFNPAIVTEHGELAGLTDDDHTIYILADGTRAFTGQLSGTSALFSGSVKSVGLNSTETISVSDQGDNKAFAMNTGDKFCADSETTCNYGFYYNGTHFVSGYIG